MRNSEEVDESGLIGSSDESNCEYLQSEDELELEKTDVYDEGNFIIIMFEGRKICANISSV